MDCIFYFPPLHFPSNNNKIPSRHSAQIFQTLELACLGLHSHDSLQLIPFTGLLIISGFCLLLPFQQLCGLSGCLYSIINKYPTSLPLWTIISCLLSVLYSLLVTFWAGDCTVLSCRERHRYQERTHGDFRAWNSLQGQV